MHTHLEMFLNLILCMYPVGFKLIDFNMILIFKTKIFVNDNLCSYNFNVICMYVVFKYFLGEYTYMLTPLSAAYSDTCRIQ